MKKATPPLPRKQELSTILAVRITPALRKEIDLARRALKQKGAVPTISNLVRRAIDRFTKEVLRGQRG